MSKKLYSLAGLLTVVAFMAMPAASQALSPQWNLNGNPTPIALNTPVPTISWGTLTLSGAGTPIKCQNIVLGNVENTEVSSVKTGVGKTFQFSTYNCENTECPGAGTGVEIAVTAEQQNPWLENLKAVTPASLTSVVELETTNVWVNIACVSASLSSPFEHNKQPIQTFPKQAVETEINWPVPSIVAGPFVCFGTSLGTNKNGSGSNSEIPSKVTFASGGSNPVLTCPSVGTGATTGKLKTMGYEANELIESKNEA